MNRKSPLKTYLIEVEVKNAAGVRYYEVLAKNKKEALSHYKKGERSFIESELYAGDECPVKLSDIQLS